MDRFGLADVAYLLIGLVIFVALGYLVTYRAEIARFIMSRWPTSPAGRAGMEPVSIPVSRYGMDASGMEQAEGAAPDMDAPTTGMPRVSRDITSGELIVLLAVMRGSDRKPRFSANAIHALVGGDRNTVLAKVKEIRNGPDAPVFPPLTDEQQQLRQQLQLDRH